MKNNFRAKEVCGKILLTNDSGRYIFLDKKEYERFLKDDIDQELKKELYEKEFLLDEKNMDNAVCSVQKKYQHLFQGTSLHIVVPTLRCNHKCLYCHSSVLDESSNKGDMDKETGRKTVDFIFQSPSKNIVIEFQGGEPLLNFDTMQEIIEYAEKKNINEKKNLRFDLATNLSKMDKDILKYLIKHKVGMCTSLDGPENVHNKNRFWNGGNAYKKVIEWIHEIKNNDYDIQALMVTTRHSLPYYKEIVDEYVNNDLKYIKLRPFDNIGFAKGSFSNIGYTAEEYLDFWKNAMDHIVNINNVEKNKIIERFTLYILTKLKGIWINYTDFQSPCGACIGQLAYNPNGDIHSCDEGRAYELFKLGNVNISDYKSMMTSNKVCSIVSASVNDTLFCDSCAYKPYCGVCPVCNYGENGNLIPVLSKNDRCKIYKGNFEYVFGSEFDDRKKKVFDSWTSEFMKDINKKE